jgi:hypothetical protein
MTRANRHDQAHEHEHGQAKHLLDAVPRVLSRYARIVYDA